jgi:hypothetical protein
MPALYDWWRDEGRYLLATDSINATKLFILGVHPDKLRPLPGAEEVTPAQIAAATSAAAEANLFREWLRTQGRARGEM